MTVWRLKKGADRRMRAGHPWAFASELAHSPREIAPGDLIELRDAQDHFLAYGYGHPISQICFRKLSSLSREKDVMSVDFFARRLRSARALRAAAGWTDFSHRWLYAEADGVPGLIVDAFAVGGDWVLVVQASTAGADRALPEVCAALESVAGELSAAAGHGGRGGAISIIEAPSSRARMLEGLSVGEKRVVSGSVEAASLADAEVTLMDDVRLRCDLLRGQKTGFFLDQQWNASLLKRVLRSSHSGKAGAPVRVLDICCYVGQWAAHSTQALAVSGGNVEVTLVDVSSAALALAERNVGAAGAAAVEAVEGDALDTLGGLAGGFDVVICDPPAFVKKKADLESGLRAYTKLKRDALKLLKPGGVFVGSSCSGLVKPDEFRRVLLEAGQKSGRCVKQLLPGGHGPDHPVRPDFPEGEYLKCTIGRADPPF